MQWRTLAKFILNYRSSLSNLMESFCKVFWTATVFSKCFEMNMIRLKFDTVLIQDFFKNFLVSKIVLFYINNTYYINMLL